MISVADTATVLQPFNVVDNARIEDTAHIGNNVLVTGDVEVYGNAIIKSRNVLKMVIMVDNCHVFGNAIIDVSHFKETVKFIFGKGCKIGGRFDLREFLELEDFITEHSDHCELSYLEDDYSSKVRCVKVTDIWLL